MKLTKRLPMLLLVSCLFIASCGSGGTLPVSPTSTLELPPATATTSSTPEPPPADPTLSPNAEAFMGEWINLDQDEGSLSWFTVQQDGPEVVVHFWGQCHPEPCDIGEERFPIEALDDGEYIFSYDFSRGTSSSTIILQDDLTLEVTTTTDFTDESGMEDRTTVSDFQKAEDVTGVLAYVGVWVYDQAENDEYSRLSVVVENGVIVVTAQAIIGGEVHDFGQFNDLEGISDGELHIDYDYPGGGLISAACVPNGAGGLDVEMFVEYMLDDVYTTHEATFTMQRLN